MLGFRVVWGCYCIKKSFCLRTWWLQFGRFSFYPILFSAIHSIPKAWEIDCDRSSGLWGLEHPRTLPRIPMQQLLNGIKPQPRNLFPRVLCKSIQFFLVICTLNLSLEIRPPKQSLNPDNDKLPLKKCVFLIRGLSGATFSN